MDQSQNVSRSSELIREAILLDALKLESSAIKLRDTFLRWLTDDRDITVIRDRNSWPHKS